MTLEEIIVKNGGNAISHLARHILSLSKAPKKEPIYEDAVLQGTTSTTTARLKYGVNVISSASSSNRCARLPEPPIKGQTVMVVNVSGQNISLFPSYAEGTINNVIDGEAIIPSDGKPYVFVCWENPLPGAWTWTPPAINQYDTGEVVDLTAPNGTLFSFVDANLKKKSNLLDGSFLADLLNPPLIINPTLGQVGICPNPMWNKITKIKFYTNQYHKIGNQAIMLYIGYAKARWGVPVTEPQFASSYNNATISSIISLEAGTRIPGTVPTYNAADKNTILAPNIADPGTYYGELVVGDYRTGQDFVAHNEIGKKYEGQRNNGGVIEDVYHISAIYPHVSNNLPAIATGFKCRVFIEYN